MRRILDALLGVPPARSKQFRLIREAQKRLLSAARADGIRLEHIEYTTPFVETDFSLAAWLFYRSRTDVDAYATNGTSEDLRRRLSQILQALGYPPDWIPLVRCRFASKEEVDECCAGSYYNYVR